MAVILEKEQVVEVFQDAAGNLYINPRTVDTSCSSAKTTWTTTQTAQLIKLSDLPAHLKAGDFPSGFLLEDLGCNDADTGSGTGTTDNDPAADIDFSNETNVHYYDPPQ